MSDDLWNEASVSVPCPHCGHKFDQPLAGYDAEPYITCPNCSNAIIFKGEDVDEVRDSLKRIDEAVKRLAEKFKK